MKRFISSSGRTGIACLLSIKDGTKHIIHTLSKKGALTDVGRKDIPGGLPMLGHDADPGVIAQQALNGPWADEWLANVVDDKPLPFETTASYKQWGGFGATPLWKRSYLGKHYGHAMSAVHPFLTTSSTPAGREFPLRDSRMGSASAS